MSRNYESAIIRKLISFGESSDQIRAMLLTSSMCNPNASSDILSDFDVEIFFTDPTPYVESDEWIKTLGPVMVLWRDKWGEGEDCRHMRMVYFQDGTKMDIQLAYLSNLRRISNLDSLPPGYDIGYKVLLDKDGVTVPLGKPTYRAYILIPPAQELFIARLEAFWMDSTYVAKYLWRDDIVAAKCRLNDLSDRILRQMLEWYVALRHNWNWKQGATGRGLSKALDLEMRTELMESYAGGDIDEMWESLFRTTALYSKAAIRLAEALGYDYPYDLDKRVSILHRTIKNLNRQTATREELAELLTDEPAN